MKKTFMRMLTFCDPYSCFVCMRISDLCACCSLPAASVQVLASTLLPSKFLLLLALSALSVSSGVSISFVSGFVCSICLVWSLCALSALSARCSHFKSCMCAFVSSTIYSLHVTMVKIPVVTLNQLWLEQLS